MAKVGISVRISWKLVRYEEERHGGDKIYLTRFMSLVLATTTGETWLGKKARIGWLWPEWSGPKPYLATHPCRHVSVCVRSNWL